MAFLSQLLSKARKLADIRGVLWALAQNQAQVRFIQIGSNDAGWGDPLRSSIMRHGWQGVLVEPLPHVYQRLRQTYRDTPGLIFEQAAISDSSAPMPFYYVEDAPDAEAATLPPWYNQIGSFDKNHLLKHAGQIPGLLRRIRSIDVPCLTFAGLCARHHITTVDVLHIDTEGHDLRILQSMDLHKLRPKLIMFESKHAEPAALARFMAGLEQMGYDSVTRYEDTICLLGPPAWQRSWLITLIWKLFVRRSRQLDTAAA